MSYDLYFRWKKGKERFPKRAISEYFQARPLYKVTDTQAVYTNETTGVYFVFDFTDERDADPEAARPQDMVPIAFNINYFRPHFFGLEAEPELTSFVHTFDLIVVDPQDQGMGQGEYSPEGFLRGWNAGNEFGYRAILAEHAPEDIRTMPTDVLESIWRWNYTRDARQEELGDLIFVPRIFLFEYSGRLQTGVAWGDVIPILLPRVDILFVPRIELAPKILFKKARDMVLFEWAELEDFITTYPRVEGALPAYKLDYETAPENLVQQVTSRTPPPEMPNGIAPDQVLNHEIVDRAMGGVE